MVKAHCDTDVHIVCCTWEENEREMKPLDGSVPVCVRLQQTIFVTFFVLCGITHFFEKASVFLLFFFARSFHYVSLYYFFFNFFLSVIFHLFEFFIFPFVLNRFFHCFIISVHVLHFSHGLFVVLLHLQIVSHFVILLIFFSFCFLHAFHHFSCASSPSFFSSSNSNLDFLKTPILWSRGRHYCLSSLSPKLKPQITCCQFGGEEKGGRKERDGVRLLPNSLSFLFSSFFQLSFFHVFHFCLFGDTELNLLSFLLFPCVFQFFRLFFFSFFQKKWFSRLPCLLLSF